MAYKYPLANHPEPLALVEIHNTFFAELVRKKVYDLTHCRVAADTIPEVNTDWIELRAFRHNANGTVSECALPGRIIVGGPYSTNKTEQVDESATPRVKNDQYLSLAKVKNRD